MSAPGESPGRSIGAKATAIVVAAGLAALSALVTWGGINKTRAPTLALAAPPVNGFAAGNAAVAALARLIGNAPGAISAITVPPALRDLALAGYRREPLAARSLGVLGLAAEDDRRMGQARRLMAAALAVSRRDGLVNGWTVADASRSGNFDAAITALNRSITTDPASGAVYIPAMLKALEQPASVAAVARVLARKPDWELRFWQQAAGYRAAIGNVGKVRVALRSSPDRSGEIDRALLDALAAAGEFATAAELYRKLPGATSGPAGVRNGAFSAQPRWPVFDWSLLSTGEFSGAIDPREGLIADALSGSGGIVARQLLTLPHGAWQLDARLAHPFEGDANKLGVRITCAKSGAKLLETDFAAQRVTPRFATRGDCAFQWLDILVKPGIAENREVLALRSIAVAPAR